MFIAMNRFKITPGEEEAFEEVWRARESHLESVPGFKTFHLLRGPKTEEYSLYASHSVWASRQAFEDWTKSEAFRMAHRSAGDRKPLYLGHPQLETFESVDLR